MLKKNVAPQGTQQTARPYEVTGQELAQVTGGSVNPLYTPLTQSGSNPLYSGS